MAAAMNGMALHGGIIPYSGTFLVFTDYMRPAIRLAALMRQRVIHVLTHDASASARTARPISRSSTWPACAPSPPACLPPGRCDGDRGMLGAGGAPRRRAERAGAVAAGPAGAAHRCRREPLRPRRLCAGRGRGARAGDADRHRLGGRDRPGGAGGAGGRRASPPRSFRCHAGSCSRSRTKPTARRCWARAPRIGIEAAVGFGWERWLGEDGDLHRHDRLRRLGPVEDLYNISASRRRPSSRR